MLLKKKLTITSWVIGQILHTVSEVFTDSTRLIMGMHEILSMNSVHTFNPQKWNLILFTKVVIFIKFMHANKEWKCFNVGKCHAFRNVFLSSYHQHSYQVATENCICVDSKVVPSGNYTVFKSDAITHCSIFA